MGERNGGVRRVCQKRECGNNIRWVRGVEKGGQGCIQPFESIVADCLEGCLAKRPTSRDTAGQVQKYLDQA